MPVTADNVFIRNKRVSKSGSTPCLSDFQKRGKLQPRLRGLILMLNLLNSSGNFSPRRGILVNTVYRFQNIPNVPAVYLSSKVEEEEKKKEEREKRGKERETKKREKKKEKQRKSDIS
jgi:hypothetical protein